MSFESPQAQTQAADYQVAFTYTGNPDPELNQQLFMSMRTKIGDLMPIEAQREAFQAVVDMINEHPDFQIGPASTVYATSEVVTPTNPDVPPSE